MADQFTLLIRLISGVGISMKIINKYILFFYVGFFFKAFSAHGPIETDVLIVGAGPAGLVLSNCLEKYGEDIKYLNIEANQGASSVSKATGLHVNSMNIIHCIGMHLSTSIIEAGVKLDCNIIVNNQKVVRQVDFSHGVLPHELNISISQESLEKILNVKPLSSNCLWYGHSLVDFFYEGDYILCLVKNCMDDSVKEIKTKFLAAADGGKSLIRKKLGIEFPGDTTAELSFSFDAKVLKDFEGVTVESDVIHNRHNMMYMHSNENGRLVMVPIDKKGTYKISGKVPDDLDQGSISNKVLCEIAHLRSGVHIDESSLNGLVYYRTQSRIAQRFSENNRIFLMGDAAHLFFPAGGYGLNIAVEDAYFLSDAIVECLSKHDDSKLKAYSKSRRDRALAVQQDSCSKKQALSNVDVPSSRAEKEVQVY
jgi:2-polyprenyl-6-methoxyphenol hydroxylase-like FAD-dependent oxidoreductase